jgi:hypothetical protein
MAALAALAIDDPATARREVSTILRLDAAFEPGPPLGDGSSSLGKV